MASHYLNQCWNIVNWTPRNKLQWNFNWNSYIFIHENSLENFIWKLMAIFSQPQCVNCLHFHGPLARYVKLRVRMRRECRERFPRHRRWAIPTCITARASRTCRDACRDRQLAVSFEIGGGGKRSRHSRRMRNLQFYVSGKRPMEWHDVITQPCHNSNDGFTQPIICPASFNSLRPG